MRYIYIYVYIRVFVLGTPSSSIHSSSGKLFMRSYAVLLLGNAAFLDICEEPKTPAPGEPVGFLAD